jgi:dTMP kinase
MVGHFLVFEGVDGCGKSTQASRLVRRLEGRGSAPLHVREPGSTQLGEALREILLNPDRPPWSPITEALLFFASRKELLEEVIQPALKEGRDVVCERFTPSTFAYQGQTPESSQAVILLEDAVIPLEWQPRRVLILDLPAQEAVDRIQKRGEADGMEKRGLAFQSQVREGFLSYAELHPDRCTVIPVSGSDADQVESLVQAALEGLWA